MVHAKKLFTEIVSTRVSKSFMIREYLTRTNYKNGQKGTKRNCLLKFTFVVWCLGGENFFLQNVVDPPLEGTEIITKHLS